VKHEDFSVRAVGFEVKCVAFSIHRIRVWSASLYIYFFLCCAAVLQMGSNSISRLDGNSFRGMRFMRRLYFENNQISTIGRQTFQNLRKGDQFIIYFPSCQKNWILKTLLCLRIKRLLFFSSFLRDFLHFLIRNWIQIRIPWYSIWRIRIHY